MIEKGKTSTSLLQNATDLVMILPARDERLSYEKVEQHKPSFFHDRKKLRPVLVYFRIQGIR